MTAADAAVDPVVDDLEPLSPPPPPPRPAAHQLDGEHLHQLEPGDPASLSYPDDYAEALAWTHQRPPCGCCRVVPVIDRSRGRVRRSHRRWCPLAARADALAINQPGRNHHP